MKNIRIIIVLLLCQINIFGQKGVQDTNQFAVKAIKLAVQQYHQQKHVGTSRNMIINMRLMDINDISGKFILNYIVNNFEYDDMNPTHYIRVNNELVLITIDRCCKSNLEEFGINKISKEINDEALGVLFNSGFCLVEFIPTMVFKYRKNRLKAKCYGYAQKVPKKYQF